VEGCASFQTSAEQRHQIYQIAREALSNIAKHSSATRAKVELVYENCQDEIAQSISLRISDNGKGATATARTGRGLSNMRERASLLGAGFEIESQDGYGTVVKLKIET
jgi:signal transduction histidine kinase